MLICMQLKSIVYLIHTLIKASSGSFFDHFKECRLVIIINEPVRKHTVNLVDPEANKLVSILFEMESMHKEKI